jgi:hypothetical protein
MKVLIINVYLNIINVFRFFGSVNKCVHKNYNFLNIEFLNNVVLILL